MSTRSKIAKFKVISFCITLILLIFYDDFPKRSIELHPQLTKYIEESVDSVSGGNSELLWLDKENLHWICDLKIGSPYPYCGISVAWSSSPFKQIDFSDFDGLEVELEYSGQARYIRVFIRNFYPRPNAQDAIGNGKFNSMTIASSSFKQIVTIPFSDLRVADWWVDDNQIPPEDIKPDVSQAIAIGIDLPYPSALGRHVFKLKSLKVMGVMFSKESLYLAIILFWAALLILEILLSQIKLRKKIQFDEQQLLKIEAKSAVYQQKAEHDKLTGVLNREGLTRIVDELYSTQLLQQYTLLVIDLDFFKQINDEHGHTTGDIVLQEAANILKNCVRSYDLISRWGGEEFVILFHCLDTDNILPFAEKLRKAIESVSYIDGKLDKLTVSVGATSIANFERFEQAFIRADKALYEAKENGRNRTVVIL